MFHVGHLREKRDSSIMEKTNWVQWNRVLLPNKQPHEDIDVSELDNKDIWREGNVGYRALVARWTSDFDSEQETNWWYCLKDSPFDLNTLKAKYRYEITKSQRNFDVRPFDPEKCIDEFFFVTKAAAEGYPEKYRPQITLEYVRDYAKWKDVRFLGAFLLKDNESEYSGKLCGYIVLKEVKECVSLVALKVIPALQKKGVNAALMMEVFNMYNDYIVRGGMC